MSDNLNFEQISTILRRSLEESLEELLQENIMPAAFANHVLGTFNNVWEQKLQNWNEREEKKKKSMKEKKKSKKKVQVSILYIFLESLPLFFSAPSPLFRFFK